jgi:dTDP-4-amino-4,6-dideoxygalactose transaminase
MGGKEIQYIAEAFDKNYIAPVGVNIDGFELDIQNYLGEGYVSALSSGTAAIHLALIMLGVTRGDYVLASSFTFSATINPIAYQGAHPILIDSEEDTWNMDSQLLENAILELRDKHIYPKAIIAAHLYGMPANLDEILKISKKYGIPLIEDAAEALGSEYKGKKLGTYGDYGILSFNGNKIITTSGGGAIICKSEERAQHAKFLASQARDEAPHYQHTHIGYNYRMSNIVAGIGRGQMEVLSTRVKLRRENFLFYCKLLKNVSGVKIVKEPNTDYFSNYWLTTILVNPKETGGMNREYIRLFFENENIETRPLWKPMHLQPIFSDSIAFINGTSERLFDMGLCLPSGSNLTQQHRDRIGETFKKLGLLT